MKKAKELKELRTNLLLNIENMDLLVEESIKKIKKECQEILIDEKNKLITKIAEGEKLDVTVLRSKYLKCKELINIDDTNKILSNQNNEELLDKIIFNDLTASLFSKENDKITNIKNLYDNKTFYYENKQNGKVYDINNIEIGIFKNGLFIFK